MNKMVQQYEYEYMRCTSTSTRLLLRLLRSCPGLAVLVLLPGVAGWLYEYSTVSHYKCTAVLLVRVL